MTPTLWILAVVLAMLAGFAARDLLHRLRTSHHSAPATTTADDTAPTVTVTNHIHRLHHREKPA